MLQQQARRTAAVPAAGAARKLMQGTFCSAALPKHQQQGGISTLMDAATSTLRFPSPQVSPVTRAVLVEAFQSYAALTPSVLAIQEIVQAKLPADAVIWHDHFAFRTFAVPSCGIRSLEEPLQQLGYQRQQNNFEFPSKKLQATWFAPNDKALYDQGLPRIFVSEVEVSKLSAECQAVIRKYTSQVVDLPPALALAALVTRTLPWPTPSFSDYQLLLKESEYAAWTLAHGYALNHSTISIHRLLPDASLGVAEFTSMIQAAGFAMNQEGGLIKISPDGLLHQSSTVSDKVLYTFAEGDVHEIAGSYYEFAERRPAQAGEPLGSEADRRDGFEVGNADKIFMSTSLKA